MLQSTEQGRPRASLSQSVVDGNLSGTFKSCFYSKQRIPPNEGQIGSLLFAGGGRQAHARKGFQLKERVGSVYKDKHFHPTSRSRPLSKVPVQLIERVCIIL